MGIITLALLSFVASGDGHHLPSWMLPKHTGDQWGVPLWVVIACASAIALGTAAGGQRIIKTMGSKIIPGMRQPIKVTMKRGMVKKEGSDAAKNGFLSGWMKDTYADPFRNHKKDILIDLCDEKGSPVIRWTVQGALPVKIEAPTFSANSNDVAIETMEVIAHGLDVSYP